MYTHIAESYDLQKFEDYTDDGPLSPGSDSEALSPESLVGEDNVEDSFDSADKFLVSTDDDSLDQLYEVESQKYEDNFSLWKRAAEELRQRAEQERAQRERDELMAQMRANYRNATSSFGLRREEEEEEEDSSDNWDYRFNWKRVKQTWLRDLPKSVPPQSSLCIIRTCVTEPGIEEVLVDFQWPTKSVQPHFLLYGFEGTPQYYPQGVITVQ